MLEITMSIQSALFSHLPSSMNLKITFMLMLVKSLGTYYTMFMRKMKKLRNLHRKHHNQANNKQTVPFALNIVNEAT